MRVSEKKLDRRLVANFLRFFWFLLIRTVSAGAVISYPGGFLVRSTVLVGPFSRTTTARTENTECNYMY